MSRAKDRRVQYMVGHKEYAGDGVSLRYTDEVTRDPMVAKEWLEQGLRVTAIHDEDWEGNPPYKIKPGDFMYGHPVEFTFNKAEIFHERQPFYAKVS